MATAKKVVEAIEAGEALLERIEDVFDALREEIEDPKEQAEAEEARDETIAELLDESEQAQAQLAASLTQRARSLHKKILAGDHEASALGAVIPRSLAAHSQAESFRTLMESPDLSQLVNVTEDDETMPPEWDEGGGDDDG